ncbi:MAG: YceG family protein, partial [Clostridium sp.]
NSMNIRNMQGQEIILFDDLEVNLKFLKALDYVIPIAIQKENFFSDNIRNNFITKLIVWAYSFLRKIDFKDDINPKCIFYGTITRHEVYFLIVLYLMDFDVIYINPLKEEHFSEIDIDNLSECIKSMSILAIETFEERVSRGNVINTVETITKQIERDVHEQLFENTGMYKPWQFRGGYTKSLGLDTILEDIYIYWNEPSKLRDGFKVEGRKVYVPCFFNKIDGQYRDDLEFQRLVKYCSQSENTLFFNSGNISQEYIVTDDMYELMFCQLSDGTFDTNEVKKLKIYKFAKYSNEVQDFILKKFNEMIGNENLFVQKLDKETILKLLVLVLSLNENIVRMIDNFDFIGQVPKIVIYLNDEDNISDSMVMVLAYLHTIGMDIVIFNPSGLFNINNILKGNTLYVIRLEQMNYKSNYKSLVSLKQSVLSRILRK